MARERKIRFNILKPSFLLCILAILLSCSDCKREKIRITVIAQEGSKVIDYASSELCNILKDSYIINRAALPDKRGWNIVLKTDSSMKPFSFSMIQSKNERVKTIYLSGHDETCPLHSVYTMLEKAGYTFDITGIRKPRRTCIESLAGVSLLINPVVERRGIRQHINFLMDISSYPVEEAKEYIRNLARLRMNYITFHSYPGQWFSYDYKGKTTPAGGFFYGEKDIVPKEEYMHRRIRNDSIFCIPAIEPFWHDLSKRSQMAIDWLNSVMAEAKRVGLTVNMSYELREPGLEYAAATSKAILKEYPLIGGLEVITEETVSNYLDQIKNNIKCSDEIRKSFNGRNISLSEGIYNTTASELREGFEMLGNNASKDLHLTVLPAYGARMAVHNLAGLTLTSDDLRRTMIYSWIEFDGLMYLQQNPVEGIRMMLEENLKISGNKPLFGICWNHWRNYENRIAIRYASEAMINEPIIARTFYNSVANRSGIANASKFASAMSKIDENDTFCRDSLFNIGFCPNGYWLRKNGLSLYGRYGKDNLIKAINQFSEVRETINSSQANTTDTSALKDLEFLSNRISCTILHLRAFVAMKAITPLFKGNPDPDLSENDREKVRQSCTEALSLERQYIEMHSQIISDDGSEGTLMSYISGPYQCLKEIMARYGRSEVINKNQEKPFDAPPEPGESNSLSKKSK